MLFVDDHNHDVDGIFHKTATEEITRTIGAPKLLPNTHPLYSAFFKFRRPADDEPRAQWLGRQSRPQESVRRDARRAHRRAVQQQGLQLRVELSSGQQALSVRGQHEIRREHRGVCPHAPDLRRSFELAAASRAFALLAWMIVRSAAPRDERRGARAHGFARARGGARVVDARAGADARCT